MMTLVHRKSATLALAIAATLTLQSAAYAAPADSALPLGLAAEAALEALRSCEGAGYHVSVAVVEPSGLAQVQLKGDSSTPHTNDLAFRKAYSIMTFGPNYSLETSAEVAALFNRNPAMYSAILTVPNIAPLPGGVAIKVKRDYFGAIGVSGSPGGDKDEACARAGIAKIADRLPQ